jgi:hypothetical protein
VGDSKWDELNDEKNLALNPLGWISDQPFFRNKEERVNDIITFAYDKAEVFLARFQPILEIYWRNKQFDIDILVHERLKNPVDNMRYVITLFKYYQHHFQTNLPSCTDIGLLQLDSKAIKTKLQPTPKEFNDRIENTVPEVNKKRTNEAKEWLQTSINDLRRPVNNVEEFVVQQGFLTAIDNRFQFIRDRVDLLGQFYDVLTDNAVNKPRKEDLNNHAEGISMISTLNQLITSLQQQQEGQSEKFKKNLQEMIPELNSQIDTLQEEATQPQYFDKANMEGDKIPGILADLDQKMENFKLYEETSERYNDWQVKLYVPQTNFDNLDELRTQLVNRHLMWHSLADWNGKQAEWMETNFGQIDAPSIQKEAEKYSKICKRLEGALEFNPIQAKLKSLVE